MFSFVSLNAIGVISVFDFFYFIIIYISKKKQIPCNLIHCYIKGFAQNLDRSLKLQTRLPDSMTAPTNRLEPTLIDYVRVNLQHRGSKQASTTLTISKLVGQQGFEEIPTMSVKSAQCLQSPHNVCKVPTPSGSARDYSGEACSTRSDRQDHHVSLTAGELFKEEVTTQDERPEQRQYYACSLVSLTRVSL